jgi:hypothetical protein
MKDYGYITSRQLGVDNISGDTLYMTIKERKDKHKELLPNNYRYDKVAIKTTVKVRRVIGNLFTRLGSIKAYDWGNRWLIVFEESSILGGIKFYMTNSQMEILRGE